jgi:hypothetical protein
MQIIINTLMIELSSHTEIVLVKTTFQSKHAYFDDVIRKQISIMNIQCLLIMLCRLRWSGVGS